MSGEGFETIAHDGLEEAEPDTETSIGVYPNPPVSQSPVIPLGFEGGRVVFAMPEGEIRSEPASKIGQMLKTDIYACAAGQAFLGHWRDREGKFQRDLAVVWFVRRCRERGIWDRGRQVRMLGVWPGSGGTVVLHRGEAVLVYERDGGLTTHSIAETLQVGRGPLYRLRPAAPEPGEPSGREDGQWVRQALDMWRFGEIGREGLTGADVVAGWVMAALLGAVAPFRGHLIAYGLQGSGKTELALFVQALLSALAGDVIDSFSEAGFRQDLAGMARPVLLDEGEATPGVNGPGPVERALEVLRRMSTGEGGNRRQGSVSGVADAQTAVGAAWLGAINPPRLEPADASRIIELRLLPLVDPGASPRPLAKDSDLKAAGERARALAPQLLGRALRGAWKYRADVAVLKAVMTADGRQPRTADLVAMVVAGRCLLMDDPPLTPAAAADELRLWQGLLDARAEAETVSNPGADALAHLMAVNSGNHVRDRYATIGELIADEVKNHGFYTETLKTFGLKLDKGKLGDDPPVLIVANKHAALDRIFEKTKWPDYRRTLSMLDVMGEAYKTWPVAKQRFGPGSECRALAIPLTPWLEGVPAVPAGRSGQADDW